MTGPLFVVLAYHDRSWVEAIQDFLKVGFGYFPKYRDSESVLVSCCWRSSRMLLAVEPEKLRLRRTADHGETAMSNSSGVKTVVVPLRKICAALPAVALIGAGIAFTAPVAPARDYKGVAVSSNSAAVVVPDTALTMPAVQAPSWTDPFTVAAPQAPALVPPLGAAPAFVLPAGTLPGSSGAVALDSTGIPVRALEAYRAAASLVGVADPACHIDWALLAAIGRVESNHARFGGNQLDAAGVAQPGIIGIRLDGTNGTARITDTDGGRLDGDTVHDRAVGPMQFIPSTWRAVGVDADGDGVKNPQDMADAATTTAIYLCSGPGDLSRPGDLHAAIMRYNPSGSYVRTVTAIAAAYRHGVRALPAADLPAANSAPSTSDVAAPAPLPAAPAPLPAAPAPLPAAPAPLPAAPAPPPAAPAPLPAAPVSAPIAAAPLPVAPPPVAPPPVPAAPDPCLPIPTPTGPCPPGPCPPNPSLPNPSLPIPTPTSPCPPGPCPPNPTLPNPTPPNPTLPNPTLTDPSLTPLAGPSSSSSLTQVTCPTVPPNPPSASAP